MNICYAGVIGKPIAVPLKENPTNAEIEEVHAHLLEEMEKLFEKHKSKYGWEHKHLVIA